MSLGLLLPVGLAALAALLLPLLLHLERQSEPRATDFAALRWLSARLRPRRSLRLEECWLLLLRLLLVASVALLFARPVLFGGDGGTPWVLLAPGVDIASARAVLHRPDAQWRWLAAGFPAIESARPAETQPLASLLREVDAQLPVNSAVTVFVPEQVGGLDGERPRLARRIDWRVVPAGVMAAVPKPRVAPPVLFVRYAPDRAASLRYLRAAALAWRASSAQAATTTDAVDAAPATQPVPAAARWLVWLAPGELPTPIQRWIGNGGVAVLDARTSLPDAMHSAGQWRDGAGDLLGNAQAMGRGRIVRLTRPLLPEHMPQLLDPEFPTRLRALFDAPAPAPQRAHADALRPRPGGPTFPETPQPLQSWLAALAAGFFLLERWYASSSRRRRTT